jgi:hypothetical protein
MRSLRRCVVVAAAIATFVLAPAASALADAVPYTDPNATGLLTLCDENGQALTSGSVSSAPFVWRAVSSQAAQAPYNELGRTATLFAYQPRQQVWSSEWSGYQLTASAKYTNAEHPMAQSTRLDGPLSDFLDSFPAQWDGFVQLRLYLGAPQQPAYTQKYATADLQVTGDTWTLVRGGSEGCTSGQASSLERLLHPNQPQPGESASPGTSANGERPGPGSSAGPTQSPGVSSAAGEATPVTDTGSSTLPVKPLLLVVGGLVVAGAFWLSRRRRGDPS